MKYATMFVAIVYATAQNQFGQQLQYQNNIVQHDENEIRTQMRQVDRDESSIQKELSQINGAGSKAGRPSAHSWQQQQYGNGMDNNNYGSQQQAYGNSQYQNPVGNEQYDDQQQQYDSKPQYQDGEEAAVPRGEKGKPAQAMPNMLIALGFIGAAAVCYINGGWRATKIMDYSSEDRFNPRL